MSRTGRKSPLRLHFFFSMPSCKSCGLTFPTRIVIEGKKVNVSNRVRCVGCKPYVEVRKKRHRFCEKCGKSTANKRFCSKQCAGMSSRVNKPCVICNAPVTSKSFGSKCCSHACHHANLQKTYISNWIAGKISGSSKSGNLSARVRNHLILEADEKCSRCGWNELHKVTGKVPLTINHIDGDAENNSPSNLEVLCPNCHSLTPNYGGLNRGKGRKNRHKAVFV